MWKSLFFLTAFAVSLGCSNNQEYDNNLIFRYNESANISSLDPAFARNQANLWAVNQLFNGLVQMDEDLNVVPCIAKSWSIRDSGTTYEFVLRDDVYFHEDECFASEEERRVTAGDFVYSLNRLSSAQLAAPGSWIMQQVSKVEAVNDTTLSIKLSQPFPPFLGLLSMKYASVVPREAVEHYGSEFRQHPVGTGAFYFKLWVANEKLVLRRNQEYFEKDKNGNSLPYLEAVAISFIPDKQSAFLEFIKGNIDLISGIDASYKDELLSFSGELQPKYQNRFELYRQPYLNTEYLGILVDSGQQVMQGSALLNSKVRQAINYGFDRKKMMKFLRNNIGTPANAGMIPLGLSAYDTTAIPGYEHNEIKALELLAEAGYPNAEGLPQIRLQTNSSYLDLCEYIQGELALIGIDLAVEVTPPSTLRQAMATSKVPFFRGSWIADYPDAENYMSLFYSRNWTPEGPNYTHFKHPQFDEWYEQAARETDDNRRIRLYQKMDSLVMFEAPVIPLYYDQVLRFYPKNIQGLEGNAMNMLDLKKVRKIDAKSEGL